MSTTDPPAQAPSATDAQAVFDRAMAAAQRAETAAQQLEAARAAAGTETQARFPDMPKQVVDQISNAAASQVVEMLRKEFELKAPAATPGSTPAAAPAAPPATVDQAPAGHRNLAHRILGY